MSKELTYFQSYCSLKKNLSNKTIQDYTSDLNLLEKYLNNQDKTFLTATNYDIEQYFSSLELKSKSFNRKMTSIIEFYKFLIYKKKKIEVNVSKLHHVKNEKIYPKIIKKEDIHKMISIQNNDLFGKRNQVIILFLYISGLRVSEMIHLTFNDLNFKEGSIRCIGKGNKEKIVMIGDLLKTTILPYQEIRNAILNGLESKYVFTNKEGVPLSRQFIYKMIHDSAIKAGIKLNVTPHTLRHCFATHMLENGADLLSVQELLGHAKITTTQIYLNIANQKIREDYFKKFKDPLKKGVENNEI